MDIRPGEDSSTAEPILNVVAPILNSFIQTVINVVNSIGQLMGALTGKTTMVTAKKVNQDYAASLNSTSTGLKNNAKNADTASKAAKQYQRTLLGFDQINKLNDDSDSSGSGGTGSGTDTSPLGGVNDMFQTTAIKSRFKDLAKLIKDSWKSGDFTELGAMVGNKLNEALERIPWGKIQNTCNKIAKSIATFLNGFIEATDWKLVGNTFSKGLNTAFGFVDTFAKNFHWNSLGKAIGDGINGALEGLDWNLIKGTVHDTVFGLVSTLNTAIATTNWSVVGKTVGECFNTRLEALYTTVHNFNWRGLGTALADLVTNTVKTIDTGKIGQTLSDGIKGFFDFAISAIEHMDWWSMGDTIYNKAKDLMVNIDWSGIADRVFETIGAAFGGFAAFIGGIFKNAVADARKYIIKHFTEAGKFTWEGFKNGVVQSFKDIGTWIKAHIFKPFINGFKKAFGIHSPSTVMRTQGGYVISGLFNGMKAGLPAVLSWIAKLPGQTKERLGNAKTWLRGKGNAAIIGLKNGWEAVRESTFLSRVKKIGSQSFNMQYTYSDCPLVVGSNTNTIGDYPWFAVDDGYAFVRNGIITPGDFIIKFGEYTLDRPNGGKFSGTLRPYYRADDVINMEFYVNGYVTSNKQEVIFLIPLSRPIMSTPVSISSINGLTIRQNGKYIYGSTASKPIKPSSYTATVIGGRNGLNVRAKIVMGSNEGFTDNEISKIVNNDTCAITASIKISFD